MIACHCSVKSGLAWVKSDFENYFSLQVEENPKVSGPTPTLKQ